MRRSPNRRRTSSTVRTPPATPITHYWKGEAGRNRGQAGRPWQAPRRGSDAVTIPMVAERAGVNHSSIYRRWCPR
ncbi:helix-turn-helix domain-containing protein [Streptomyces olivochromogenes]|uniref:helix-turn-helix domain-containing protein n=1 Tax=Streptomyces olivochromogenes TaxID=1963 RepID=UPI0036CD51E8